MAGETCSPLAVVPGESCVDHAIRGKCNPHDADRVIAELAQRQHGVVGRWQLIEAGVGRRSIDERLGRRLHPLHRGVYAVGYRVARAESRWIAAVLASGPNAVLSHRSAARLWGLISHAGQVPEITRPRHFRMRPGIRAHRALLPDDERTAIDGIPVTTAPRTLLDLAAVATRRQVEMALNEMEVLRLADRLSIPDLLNRYPRRRGSAVLRELLGEGAEARGAIKLKLEERFAAVISAHGLPQPRRNADLAVRGRFFNVDCLWADARLIVELDGRAAHGTRSAFESDRERDRLMLTEGWRVIRITWRQLQEQEPTIVADLRIALARGRELR